MKRKSTTLAIMAFSALAAVSSQGAVIWTNPITGTNPNTSNPYTIGQTVDPNLTVSGIGRGPGITGNSGNDRYNATGWSTGGTIDVRDYFTFTLDANSGFEIDFTSLVYVSQASGTGPTSFAVRSSLDTFEANITGTPTATGATISLAGAAFQNITAPIEFRVYGFGASSGAGTYSVNSFTFNGDVVSAVPEPSAALLGGLGMLALLRRRR